MKIAFLCGSLEPGRDGVGDYTRRLAVELIKQGHQATIISLNDAFITEEYSGSQYLEEINLPVLRIPHILSSDKRFERAKEFIEVFNPDWASLQFVPYSFHKKGLPFSQIKYFKRLLKDKKLHIMLHEAWIGKGDDLNFKKIIYSIFQKSIIKKLFKSINPVLVHTHIPFYFKQFNYLGWVVKKLPLFSNIAVFQPKQKAVATKKIKIGFFSQMEITDSILQFLNRLKNNLNEYSMDLEILLFGGSETKANVCRQVLEKEDSLRGSVIVKGHLSNNELSLTLQQCDLGITPVPRHALGKSGSVAAFIAHGVPVAAPNVLKGYQPNEIGFFNSTLCSVIITQPDKNAIDAAGQAAAAASKEIELTGITKTFVSDLILLSS